MAGLAGATPQAARMVWACEHPDRLPGLVNHRRRGPAFGRM